MQTYIKYLGFYIGLHKNKELILFEKIEFILDILIIVSPLLAISDSSPEFSYHLLLLLQASLYF